MARSSSRSAADRTPTSDHHEPTTSATSSSSLLAPPTPDLFLLCRPPPSSSHHQLDVHVQLVQPGDPPRRSGRGTPTPDGAFDPRPDTPGSTAGRSFDAVAEASVGRRGSQSGEEDDEADEARSTTGRSRSPSVSSTRSGTSRDSVFTDGTSASGRSGSSGTGGKRRVVPLLALQYHSLLPTVVNDAGTGQRVARFHKRGIELNGLTMLDPTYINSPSAAADQASSPRSSFLAVPGASPSKGSDAGGFFGKLKRRSVNLSAAPPPSAAHSPDTPHLLSLVRTPSPTPPAASHRAAGYAFLLRKWLRSDLVDAPRSVRIEWTRAPLRRRTPRRPRSVATSGNGPSSAPVSRRGSQQEHGVDEQGVRALPEEEDEEDEPDEEEEERAWLCTLVYPLSGPAASPSLASTYGSGSGGARSSSAASSPAPSPPLGSAPSAFLSTPGPTSTPAQPSTTRRLLLATLRPAPHHPKLVSTLLLPPSLPSIPLGAFHPSRGLLGGALAPEDLRDLVMVTSLWLAVRERLGGLEGVALGEGAGAGGLGLATSRSGSGAGTAGTGDGDVGGVAALTEKAGLAIQGLVAPGSAAGGKRASTRGGGTSGFVGRLFGAK